MAERPGAAETPGQPEPVAHASVPTPGRRKSPTWLAMSGLGFEFVAAILLPGALGWWLDRMAGTSPWLMLGGGLLGFVAGLRLLMRSVNKPRGKA
jgi:F0F1-type ATP synthase assembly protein I